MLRISVSDIIFSFILTGNFPEIDNPPFSVGLKLVVKCFILLTITKMKNNFPISSQIVVFIFNPHSSNNW